MRSGDSAERTPDGELQRRAPWSAAPASRRLFSSVLRVAPQKPELHDRKYQDQDEQNPRHRGSRADEELIGKAGFIDVLDNRPRRIRWPAIGQDEDLHED